MFSLESPHRGDFNEYTQYTIFNMNKKKHPKLSKICSYVLFSKGLKNEFETAVVNKPSVFEPKKFFCTLKYLGFQCGSLRMKSFKKVLHLKKLFPQAQILSCKSSSPLTNGAKKKTTELPP